MIIETVKRTGPFYVILISFIISYFTFLMLTKDEGFLPVFKTSYTLTLGDLDYETLDSTNFFIFVVFTTMITLILMNIMIAILSDAYELVTSEKKYYDAKVKLQRSLAYERLIVFVLSCFR